MAGGFQVLSEEQLAKNREQVRQAMAAADSAAKLKKEQDNASQLADEERVFGYAKRGLDAKTDAQSRLQKEGASQRLESQKVGIEGQSRLQSEGSAQRMESQKASIEGQSRIQREGADQRLQSQREGTESQSRLQREGASQRLESQKVGIEGQSRIQKEGFDGRSKLQAQAAAEEAGRRAGDRAAALAQFRSSGRRGGAGVRR